MDAHQKFWLVTAILLSVAIYAAHSGAISWAILNYPQQYTQAMFSFVVLIFASTLLWVIRPIARGISRNDHALHMLRRGEISSQCEVLDRLVEAQKLREKGKRIEQFQTWYLHVFVKDRFRENMEEGLGSVDNVKIALFLFGVFLVYVGLAYGSGTMKPPSTVEGVGPFLSAMIKNQGMVLVPVAACIGSFLILQVIQDHLQSHVRRMQSSFDDALLNVVIFGQDIRHCLDPLEGG